MNRKVKFSKSILEKDRFARWIFARHVGVQMYLAIGSCHLRSQYFSACLWRVVKAFERKPPASVQGLSDLFFDYGRGDGAVQEPWRRQMEMTYSEDQIKDWSEWHRKSNSERIARNELKRIEREGKLAELFAAINGINPWEPEYL